jgi:hypothetical protein
MQVDMAKLRRTYQDLCNSANSTSEEVLQRPRDALIRLLNRLRHCGDMTPPAAQVTRPSSLLSLVNGAADLKDMMSATDQEVCEEVSKSGF